MGKRDHSSKWRQIASTHIQTALQARGLHSTGWDIFLAMVAFLYTLFFDDFVTKYDFSSLDYVGVEAAPGSWLQLGAWNGVYQLVGKVPRCGGRSKFNGSSWHVYDESQL